MLPAKVVHGTDMSSAMCLILESFYSEHEFNIETLGVRLQLSKPSAGTRIRAEFRLYARYGGTVAYEKAEKQLHR